MVSGRHATSARYDRLTPHLDHGDPNVKRGDRAPQLAVIYASLTEHFLMVLDGHLFDYCDVF